MQEGEMRRLTCAAPSSDGSDSDGDDHDEESGASADDQSTIENPTNSPSALRVDDEDLEMIVVRDDNEGEDVMLNFNLAIDLQVYNTYGTMGNAALLHRYGFTELDNQYDIVNIDLAMVTKWCVSIFSGRQARARVSLWRNLGFSGCTSQDAEYFEISYDGEPQLELRILLYIITLRPDVYDKLICVAHDLVGDDEHDTIRNVVKFVEVTSSSRSSELNGLEELPDVKKLLHSEIISSALLSLADMRESLYGSNTLQDDEEKLQACCIVSERKLYHSLVLRVSERRILYRLRKYASIRSKTKKKKHL